jgi:predicted Rossmann-fold nucleotide-binding protein
VVVTGIGHGRNLAVAATGDAAIAVGGSWGTLAEIAFAKVLGRPVVVLEPGWRIEGVDRVATPEEAVDYVMHALAAG